MKRAIVPFGIATIHSRSHSHICIHVLSFVVVNSNRVNKNFQIALDCMCCGTLYESNTFNSVNKEVISLSSLVFIIASILKCCTSFDQQNLSSQSHARTFRKTKKNTENENHQTKIRKAQTNYPPKTLKSNATN